MSGDAANADFWTGADVYIGDDTAAGPTDTSTAWGTGWTAVGLLDGDEGITETRDEDSKEYFAWGGLLVRKVRSKRKRTVTFVALEDNPTVFALVNPGSTSTTVAGTTTNTIKTPTTEQFKLGFELRDGSKIARKYAVTAEVDKIDPIKDGENEPTVYKVTCLIYPESDGTLFHEIKTA